MTAFSLPGNRPPVEKSTDNQRGEIAVAGYAIEPRRVMEEKVSGSVPASQRPGFVKLLDKPDKGDRDEAGPRLHRRSADGRAIRR